MSTADGTDDGGFPDYMPRHKRLTHRQAQVYSLDWMLEDDLRNEVLAKKLKRRERILHGKGRYFGRGAA